ncbi:putative helicase [Besnoitia besnoiti]|uniref:Putative helicase n=1 Tax=Besnoitia besnoiti TaxID=94643 RepID=A0A2A9MGY4_BESBE|nr:putative helicase [Besnoitia besnoiti]PFH34923.1 putative helicase [Besnoitia besnoiti]
MPDTMRSSAPSSASPVCRRTAAQAAAGSIFFRSFEPYPVQRAFMAHVAAFLDAPDKKFTTLEMPTGTGKTVALLASALTWLEQHEEELLVERMQAERTAEAARRGEAMQNGEGGAANSLASAQPKKRTVPPWIRAAYEKQKREAAACVLLEEEETHRARLLRAAALKRDIAEAQEKSRRGGAADGKEKSVARVAAALWKKRKKADAEQGKKGMALHTPHTGLSVRAGAEASRELRGAEASESDEEALLLEMPADLSQGASGGEENASPLREGSPQGAATRATRKTQLVVASRTHSQLRQYIEELRRIQREAQARAAPSPSSAAHGSAAAPEGAQASRRGRQPFLARLKVAVLGGRDRLCINAVRQREARGRKGREADGASFDGASDVADACALLLEKSKCAFYSNRAGLVDLALTECMDVENLAAAGASPALLACPYFAAKDAAKEADVILLPTSALLSDQQREALEVSLEGALVVIDEAHHLPQSLADAASSRLDARTLSDVVSGLRTYLAAFQDRMHPRSIHALLQLQRFSEKLFEGLSAYGRCEPRAEKTAELSLASPSASSSASSSSLLLPPEPSAPASLSATPLASGSSSAKGAASQGGASGGREAVSEMASDGGTCLASTAAADERHAVFSPSQFLRHFQLGDFALHELALFLSHPKAQLCRRLRGFLMRKNRKMRVRALGRSGALRAPAGAERRAARSDSSSQRDCSAQAGGDSYDERQRPYRSTCLYALQTFIGTLLGAGADDKVLLRYPPSPSSLRPFAAEASRHEACKRGLQTGGVRGAPTGLAHAAEPEVFRFSSVQVVCLDVVSASRRCLLMGGTMGPRLRFAPLHAALPASSIFSAFSGSHVVADKNLLLLPIPSYQNCVFDSRVSARWRLGEQQEALLHLLVTCAAALPPGEGLAVFFASFSQLRAFSVFFNSQAASALRSAFQRGCPHIFVEQQEVSSQTQAAMPSPPAVPLPFGGAEEASRKREREIRWKPHGVSAMVGSARREWHEVEPCNVRTGGVIYGKGTVLFDAYKAVLMAPPSDVKREEKHGTMSFNEPGRLRGNNDEQRALFSPPSNPASPDSSQLSLDGRGGAEPEKPKAALFCVMNGALSEGVNFHDNLARLLVLVGLPFPSIVDPEFQLRSAHFASLLKKENRGTDRSAEATPHSCAETQGEPEGRKTDAGTAPPAADIPAAGERKVNRRLNETADAGGRSERLNPRGTVCGPCEGRALGGTEAGTCMPVQSSQQSQDNTSTPGYGLLQCMQTVNQTIGRAIRHSQDYAAVLLADHRYTDARIAQFFSPWIQDALRASQRAQSQPAVRSPISRHELPGGADFHNNAREHDVQPGTEDALKMRLTSFFKRIQQMESERSHSDTH